jgi:hypothetical protein
VRLTSGEPPIAEDFDPEAEGYAPMREPSASVVSYLGGGIGIAMAAVCGWVLWPAVPPLHADLLTVLLEAETADATVFLVALLGIVVLIVPIHEAIHFLSYPAGPDRGIGVWPRKLMFYAYTTGPVTRGRFIACLAMPFVVLTVLPSALLLATGAQSIWIFAAVLVHTSMCGGDALIVYLLLTRVPAGAVCRNRGWATYYAKR